MLERPSSPPAATRRGALLRYGALALLLGACSAPALDETSMDRRSAADGSGSAGADPVDSIRPTLEEVFLIPGPHGSPPVSRELSADGRWLLFSWRELEVIEGARRLADSPGPRLLATFAPGASDHRGVPLRDVLARTTGLDDEALGKGRLVHAFDPEGARLAVALGQRVFLLEPPADGARSGDPLGWTAQLALDLSSEDGEAAEAEHPAHDIRSIQGLGFEPRRAGRLAVSGSGQRVLFDPDAPTPWDPASATALTRDFPTGARPRWSEDHAVAFSPTRALARLDPASGAVLDEDEDEDEDGEPPGDGPGDEPGDDPSDEPGDGPSGEDEAADSADAAEPLEASVWRRDGDRYVVLEDWPEGGSTSLSPRGDYVLHTEVHDELAPDRTLVPDYLTERVTTRNARRQWADDVAYPRTVRVWDLRTGTGEELTFPDDEGTWTNAVGWAPNPDGERPERHLWMRLSADHATMELWAWTAEDGLERLWRERDRRWYGGPASWPRWTPDGARVVLASEATDLSLHRGHSQLFALDVERGAIHQLTGVAGEVDSFRVLHDGSVLYTASEDDPRRRTIGRVSPGAVRGATGRRPLETRRFELPPGWNESPRLSRNGQRLVFSHQTVGQPAELYALDVAANAPARRLTETVPEPYRAISWIRPVPHTVEHADGTRVAAHVYLPPTTSLERPDRPRPAIVFIHGAGYLQNVTDSMTEYEVNLMFHSRLARMGYVVVDVDYRGSKGYGGAFRTDVQYHLGRYELDDIHRVLDDLAERGVIDADRAACYGGSYGGFLTLMALFTAPERWVAGAALRSVTDWRTYHPRYTQPRLGRPSTHAEAYERSSPIDLAEHLEDPLLILHGMVDSNVFAQDSIRLIEALIDMGKDFDAMLYPSQGHAFDDGMHWLDEYRRIERFLVEHLGAP